MDNNNNTAVTFEPLCCVMSHKLCDKSYVTYNIEHAFFQKSKLCKRKFTLFSDLY